MTLLLHVSKICCRTYWLTINVNHLGWGYHEVLEFLAAKLFSNLTSDLIKLYLYFTIPENVIINKSLAARLHEICSSHLFFRVSSMQWEDIIRKLSLVHLCLDLISFNIDIKWSCPFSFDEYFRFGLIIHCLLKLKLLILKWFIIKCITNQRIRKWTFF